MPRKPKPPSYLHHKPSGQARVRIDGKDVYLGAYGSKESRTAYRKVLDQWEDRQTSNASNEIVRTPSKGLSIASLAIVWEDDLKIHPEIGPNERKRYKTGLERILAMYQHTPAAGFSPDCLEAVRASMIQLQWTRGYTNAIVQRIKRLWKWAARKGLVPIETYQQLCLVEGIPIDTPGVVESEPVEPVPDAHVDASLPFLTGPVAAMVRLQRLTGMRPGEARLLRPCDLDRSGTVWVYRMAKHKNRKRGHKRTIYIGPQAQALLLPFLDREPTVYCFSPRDALKGKRGGGRADLNDHYSIQTYSRAVLRAAKKAKVPDWHPSRIRHTVGTIIRAEHGPDAARAVLGHHSLQATEIYCEVDGAKARRIMGATG